jgi:hypothetical protein
VRGNLITDQDDGAQHAGNGDSDGSGRHQRVQLFRRWL